MHLRQQKLSSPYRLLSKQKYAIKIYDSRNYQVRIDVLMFCFPYQYLRQQKLSSPYRQHRPRLLRRQDLRQQKLSSPYRHRGSYSSDLANLRQQKLSSPYRLREGICSKKRIYDSRNYQVRIDPIEAAPIAPLSTIVEIIKSVQTFCFLFMYHCDLRQQKLSSPYRQSSSLHYFFVYLRQQKLSSPYRRCSGQCWQYLNLRQQKLSSPYRHNKKYKITAAIYDSRNYQVRID